MYTAIACVERDCHTKGAMAHLYVAVTGRKRTLFLSLFDHFFEFTLL